MNIAYNETLSFWEEKKAFEKNIKFNLWKNAILILFFFIVTPVTLIITTLSLFSFNPLESTPQVNHETAVNLLQLPKTGVRVYAALPVNSPTISAEAAIADARPEILRQYMESYGSPLALYSQEIVEKADKYGLDFRLITAIAQQESNLCKAIPLGTYNCWGWGIHSQGTLGFTSFTEGVEEVSKGLREEYLNKGFSEIEKIMAKYTPLSNGSWAYGVTKFMSEMQ